MCACNTGFSGWCGNNWRIERGQHEQLYLEGVRYPLDELYFELYQKSIKKHIFEKRDKAEEV